MKVKKVKFVSKSVCRIVIVTPYKSEVIRPNSITYVRRLIEQERKQWKKQLTLELEKNSDKAEVGPFYVLVSSISSTGDSDYLSFYEPPQREFTTDFVKVFDDSGYKIVGGVTDDVFITFLEKIYIYYRRV